MTERPYPAYGNDPKFGSAQLRNTEGHSYRLPGTKPGSKSAHGHPTKKAVEKIIAKLAKTVSAPLLPTRTRNFLQQESERLEKAAKQRARKIKTPQGATTVTDGFHRDVERVSQDRIKGPIVKDFQKKFAGVPQVRTRKTIEGEAESYVMPEGRKPTIIHVNQLVIRQNRKHGTNEPPLTIRKGRNGQNASRAHEVEILGPSKIIHSPDKPLKCGARVWIETNHPVKAK